MKKLFTLLFVFVLATEFTFSQTFGLKLGFNSSAIGVSEDDLLPDDQQARAGFQIGGLAVIEVSDIADFRTGLTYTQKGASWDVDGSSSDLVFALDYLEVPLDFAFKIGDNGFSLNAGSYLAFLLGAELRFDGESDDAEDISAMDFGLDFGASYLINETILLDIKYGMGLGNLIDDDDVDGTALNGALQFSVAYVFNN